MRRPTPPAGAKPGPPIAADDPSCRARLNGIRAQSAVMSGGPDAVCEMASLDPSTGCRALVNRSAGWPVERDPRWLARHAPTRSGPI